jgi:hypothetical protein
MQRRRGVAYVSGGLALLACATFTITAQAQESAAATPEQAINVTVNDSAVPFPGQGPIRREGTILVPLRGVFEKLGASVQYQASTKTIVAVRGETTITLRVGDANGFVNGFPRPLSVPAEVVNGATLVPLRFIAEAFGGKVAWDIDRHLAQVTTPDKSTKPDRASNATTPIAEGAAPIAIVPPPVSEGLSKVAEAQPKTTEGQSKAATPKSEPKPETKPAPKKDDPGSKAPVPATGSALKEVPKPDASATGKDTAIIDSVAFETPAPLLHGGEKVTVTVTGTPGSMVTISVPKLFSSDTLLKEDADKPGTYVGQFSIPFNTTATDIVVSANLKADDKIAEAKEATGKFAVDSAGPDVTDVTPEDKKILKTVRPVISGKYADVGAKIDAKGTRIFVNEQEVTSKATITDTGFTYTPDADLPVGPVTVSVLAKDEYGNETRKEWEFTAQPPVKAITKIVVAPTNTLRAGETLTVRLNGAPGGVAKFSVGAALKNLPMMEESAGVYIGTYVAKKGDKLTREKVAVTITTKDGDTITQNAPETISISAATPTAPIIDSPIEGAKVGGYVVISGRAEPFSKVRITLRYEGKTLGIKKNENLAIIDADVEENGAWKSETLLLDTPRNVGSVIFIVEAITVATTGELSPMSSVRFKK